MRINLMDRNSLKIFELIFNSLKTKLVKSVNLDIKLMTYF